MPDLKISDLTQDITPSGADFMTTIESPFGAGSNRKVLLSDLSKGVQSFPITAKHSGNLPQGVTVFFVAQQLVSNYVPLFVADANYTVDSMYITGSGNGAAGSDTYTALVNGAPQAMVVILANANSGLNTTNPFNIVSGQTVGVQVATSAGTIGADMLIQLKIRKTS